MTKYCSNQGLFDIDISSLANVNENSPIKDCITKIGVAHTFKQNTRQILSFSYDFWMEFSISDHRDPRIPENPAHISHWEELL